VQGRVIKSNVLSKGTAKVKRERTEDPLSGHGRREQRQEPCGTPRSFQLIRIDI
jgi:hypothetical protein